MLLLLLLVQTFFKKKQFRYQFYAKQIHAYVNNKLFPVISENSNTSLIINNVLQFKPVKLDPRLDVLKIFMIFRIYCS